jgi:hypothetical protein
MKKNYFSSHMLPKQQSTNFWSQGILGVNVGGCIQDLVGFLGLLPCKDSFATLGKRESLMLQVDGRTQN